MGKRRDKDDLPGLPAEKEMTREEIFKSSHVPQWIKDRIIGKMCKCGKFEAERDGTCMRCKR